MNSFKFNCKECNQSLEAENDMAGEELICPKCNNPIQVPQNTKTKKSFELGMSIEAATLGISVGIYGGIRTVFFTSGGIPMVPILIMGIYIYTYSHFFPIKNREEEKTPYLKIGLVCISAAALALALSLILIYLFPSLSVNIG